MSKKIIFFVTVFYSSVTIAQNLNQKLISNGGNYFSSGNYNISWSIGEPVTATHSTGTNKISQGFHQPPLRVTYVKENNYDMSVVVFPNPALKNIQIIFPTADESYNLLLNDITGKLIKLEKINSVKNFSLDLDGLSSGEYHLSIIKMSNSKKSIYKILKSE